MLGRTVFVVGVLALVACGKFIATDGDEPTAQPVDGGQVEGSADGGAPRKGDGGNGVEPTCTETELAGATDLYVTTTGSSDGACTAAAPCSLIAALARNPSTINIADGDYHGAFTLTGALHLIGGWTVDGAVWKRSCKDKQVHIIGDGPVPTPTDSAVTIDHGAVTIAYVDIATKPIAGEGESLYGLLVKNQSMVTLDHVNVVAANAGNGTAGSVGVTGPPTCAPDSDGAAGGAGGPGAPGSIELGPDGVVSKPAAVGGSGGAGHPGSKGVAPQPMQGVSTCFPNADSSACLAVTCSHTSGAPGTNGCGGGGGTGGTPGTNGGSSFALYVTGSSDVRVTNGSLTSGNGGAGGNGGTGAAGGPGTIGMDGPDMKETQACYDGLACDAAGLPACDPSTLPAPTVIRGGAAGGSGGNGGGGGAGGAGAGGHSIAWRKDSTSAVDLAATPAAVGSAGAGGLPNGVAGIAAESKQE